MKLDLDKVDSRECRAAISVIQTIREHGHIAYLAGGCVRDLLLGVDPKDFDVATDARPEQIGSYFRKTASVGAAFGVMLVRDFKETIEVATFRSDGSYSDARRPDSVEFSSPQEDAKRRDFTINALYYDPFANDGEGSVIDLVHGIEDLELKALRAVGNPSDRFAEDHLRALRAIRFASKYDLNIEPITRAAIIKQARQLSGVSIERIGEEMRKMLLHPSRVSACTLIDELELDDAIFDDHEGFDPRLMSTLPEHVEYPISLVAYAIGRGHHPIDDPEPTCAGFRTKLDLSNVDRDGMRAILECLRGFIRDWDKLRVAHRKRLVSRAWGIEALNMLKHYDPIRGKQVRQDVDQLRDLDGGLAPDPYVSGRDLIKLGLKPGKRFKEILDTAYDEQLEGRVLSQPQAIEFVQQQVSNDTENE